MENGREEEENFFKRLGKHQKPKDPIDLFFLQLLKLTGPLLVSENVCFKKKKWYFSICIVFPIII